MVRKKRSLRPTVTLTPRSGAGAVARSFLSPESDFSLILGGSSGEGFDFRLNHNRWSDLTVEKKAATVLTVPDGLSSPHWSQGSIEFSSALSAAPVLAFSQYPPSTSCETTRQQQIPWSDCNHISSIVVDKPADDGYNWRKYGQKQVKGSNFPRSYYKCTRPKCPAKKKVERSVHGQITEIIYKGQHNHMSHQSIKCGVDNGFVNKHSNHQEKSEFFNDPNFSYEKLLESSEREVVDGAESYDDEPNANRRNTEGRFANPAASHQTVSESKIVLQTTSEVDLLDDGYRWRKYGQKVVKGNIYPRSYYKCTSQACNVRKHVERPASDPKAVVTTYEGKHNHGVPAGRINSHDTTNNTILLLRPQGTIWDESKPTCLSKNL